MTTTQSPTTAARQTRNTADQTTERVKQGAQEVTERADQHLQTVDLARGVGRHFEFVQKAVDINRELATNWADAVTSLTGAVREQTEKAGQLVAEQTDKIETATREQADTVDQAEKNRARRTRQTADGHTDESNERVIETK